MSFPADAPEGPRPVSARELQAVILLEREGRPFLMYRDADGEHRLIAIPTDRELLTVGRNPSADLCFDWDGQVSGLHAELEQSAGELTLNDDGLSRNGSYVNGERVRGRRRLQDGDMLRFGRTVVLFRVPLAEGRAPTVLADDGLLATSLSPQQRKVLIALCRPYKTGGEFATPPTNQVIADELFLSVDAIKVHLRALFDKFGVAGEAQNQKRVALVARAMQSGLITDRDL